jgi:thiol-disulfide isomerase/thioredoxin
MVNKNNESMKKLFLHIALFFSLVCFSQNEQLAQNEANIQKELGNLHINTRKINDSIRKLMKECDSQIKSEKDSITKNKLELRFDELFDILDLNDIAELKINLDYAKQHPSSLYCLELVQRQISRQPGKNFYDDFEEVYTNAFPEVRNSDSGKKMAEQLYYFKQSKVGSLAPEFTVIDIEGKPLSLNDYKEKQYVLIDFWASWCAPCREELPYIKELYKKYSKEGFEVISITQDKDLEAWKKAILKDKIESWRHFSTLENNDLILKDYFVNGIPHKILIDKQGRIIGKWKGSGEKNKKELQNLFAEIFNN